MPKHKCCSYWLFHSGNKKRRQVSNSQRLATGKLAEKLDQRRSRIHECPADNKGAQDANL